MTRQSHSLNRRQFIQTTALSAAGLALGTSQVAVGKPSTDQVPELANAIGIVSASAHAQMTGRAQGRAFTLLDLPGILRNELDLKVVDLNTSSFPDFAKVESCPIPS